MPHVDSAPEGGKFRAVAAAGLDGLGGAWGNGDLLSVAVDANGELVTAGAADLVGVIWTSEGRRNTEAAVDKQIVGGAKYTVFNAAELVEMGEAQTPSFAAGDKIWAKASGTVGTSSASGDRFIGFVDNSGERAVINVGLLPDG